MEQYLFNNAASAHIPCSLTMVMVTITAAMNAMMMILITLTTLQIIVIIISATLKRNAAKLKKKLSKICLSVGTDLHNLSCIYVH